MDAQYEMLIRNPGGKQCECYTHCAASTGAIQKNLKTLEAALSASAVLDDLAAEDEDAALIFV
jgi:hypothetical protein